MDWKQESWKVSEAMGNGRSNLHEPFIGSGDGHQQCKNCKYAFRGIGGNGYRNGFCAEYPFFTGDGKPTEVLDNVEDGCDLFEEGCPCYIGNRIDKAVYDETVGKLLNRYYEKFSEEFPLYAFSPDDGFKRTAKAIRYCLKSGKTAYELRFTEKH